MNRCVAFGVVIAAAIAMTWIGCGTQQGPVGPEGEASLGGAARPAAPPAHRLMDIEGVVGVFSGDDGAGRPAILVLAEREGVAGVPAFVDGVPVVTRVSGRIVALGKPGGKGGGDAVDPTARFARPVPIGVSTGHPAITAGTIGARVKDGAGLVFALSNNHVYADMNQAILGDGVIQPGTYDGGSLPADSIGSLSAFKTLIFNNTGTCPQDPSTCNRIDAAIAASSTDLLGRATPANGYGTPKAATAGARINQKVQKYGRTTGQTQGIVAGLNGTVDVDYGSAGVARFTGQIAVQPGGFSAGGDSGSLIVSRERGTESRRPVGLLFAGSPYYTIANPIAEVLGELGVAIDGE